MVHDLDYWPRNSHNNFVLKNCFFGAFNIVKGSNESKYLHSSYEIALDEAVSWKFWNDFTRNFINCGADSSSLCHANNHKNNFLSIS